MAPTKRPKALKVAVVRMYARPVFTEEGDFEIASRKSSFSETLADGVVSSLTGQKRIPVTVKDYGDLIESENAGGMKKADLARVGTALKKIASQHDLVVVLGGSHSIAYPVYHVPGKVLRMDLHADEGTSSQWGQILHYGALGHAVKDGLKKPGQITQMGLIQGKKYGETAEPNEKIGEHSIVDICGDAFNEYHGIKSVYPSSPKGLTAIQMALKVKEANPRVISFAEIEGGNKAQEIVNLLVMQALKRKQGGRI